VSGKLQLRLSQYLLGPAATQGAVATIYPLDGETEASRRQSVVIPAGPLPPRPVEVPAGRYLVEALLPSGETVAEQVSVAEGGEEAVDLQGTAADHEWLSWQRLIGNVGRGATRTRRRHRAVARCDVADAYRGRTYTGYGKAALPPPPGQRTAVARPATPSVRFVGDPANPLRGDEDSADAWSLVAAVINKSGPKIRKAIAPNAAKRIKAGDSDRAHQLYRLVGDGVAPQGEPPIGHERPVPRRYLLAEGQPWTELTCLPVPWFVASTQREAIVEVLVRADPNAGESALATAIRDPDLGSALSYMTIGALVQARQIYEQAKDMLYGKVRNPLAAAGGGYVLLGTEPIGQHDDWPAWIENLRNWFPWLPDGSIQAGWIRLKRRRRQTDVDEARDAFHEAVHRGLPYYSIGLQRLVEGLNMFAGEPETDRLLRQVRAVAWHANLQQPFTTLRLRG
jgi:hypothetical protein